jgi:hypothetical protein
MPCQGISQQLTIKAGDSACEHPRLGSRESLGRLKEHQCERWLLGESGELPSAGIASG